MTLTATDSGRERVLAPEGTHIARCIQVIDLGTQYSEYYKKSQPKVLIGWEIPNELYVNDDGNEVPFLVWKRFTVSTHEKATLTQYLTAWRGRPFTNDEAKEFQITKIIGSPCMLSIVHEIRDKKTYDNVVSVVKLMRDTPMPKQVNPSLVFDLDDFNEAVFSTFSENLQTTISNSSEMKARSGATQAGPTDDLPPDESEHSQQPEDDCPF